jgi:inhibitor of cysteine peptidase
MFKLITLILTTIIMLTSLVGCAKTATPSPSSNTNSDNPQADSSGTYPGTNATDEYEMLPIISGKAANIQLDASADGTTQQLKKGEVIAITLESNPSTGFGWFATSSNPDVLSQIGEPDYKAPQSVSSTPLVGVAGTDTFLFGTTATGTATLTLVYKQGWVTDVAPEKSISITVEVK